MSCGAHRSTDEVSFATSGQSDCPVVWVRTVEQMRAEAALLADTVIGEVDRVVNFAPPRHLYGSLLGEYLPAHLRVPVRHQWEDPLSPVELAADERVLLVCLPATWVVLRSHVERLRSLSGVVAVHGTGPTTTATDRIVEALAGARFRGVELLGSTETGAIAHRPLVPSAGGSLGGSPLWTLFDDTSLVSAPTPSGEQPLRVRSPRLARRENESAWPDSLELDDLVRPRDGGRFELLGRSSRLVKVNGVRLHLEHVEHALRERFPHTDIVCVPVRDDVRAEHFDLYYTDLADTGEGTVAAEDLHGVLKTVFPQAPLPRVTHGVARIPRGAAGKVRLDLLLSSLETAPGGDVRE
ncbi:hypothetical protein RIF23_14560 [Lipingzhangella sp. LS1_29]|uniref:Uncharacterized protein n=1 Tax=Lipingzhangella rawalii TaxID=2055835 RepID=A0ABU2H8B7_9ACTN|nr:hypothetical protein [Lipingzhangella rawalii]MDS1271518.1 hypothetical protein [Lipingzhangella rawalii]